MKKKPLVLRSAERRVSKDEGLPNRKPSSFETALRVSSGWGPLSSKE
jgi:hypothetical protein